MKIITDSIFYGAGVEYKDVLDYLAYLEKQKEQKPIEPSDDELQRHQDELYNFKVFAAKQAKEHHISYVHDFEWNNFCAEILSYFNEQKPAEWSEEDENNLELVIDCIYKFYPDPVMKYKLKEWLKDLRLKLKKKNNDVAKHGYDEAYLQEKIAKASKTWEGVDADKYLDEVRGREQEQPQVADASKMEQEVDLEKEIDKGIADYSFTKTIDSGGFKSTVIDYAKIARHFYELGLKARKEE